MNPSFMDEILSMNERLIIFETSHLKQQNHVTKCLDLIQCHVDIAQNGIQSLMR